MEFIKKYNPSHYRYYLNRIDSYVGKHKDINGWIKSLSNDELIMWTSIVILSEKNVDEYYEEISILLTLIIRFFIIELDIDQNIKLKNSKILSLIKNFKKSVFREYSNRYDIDDFYEETYTILK